MGTTLVCGGAGHIGSHVCEELVKKGCSVISLDNYFNGHPSNHTAGVEYRYGHTKNISKLITEDVDIVYHLGEYARVTPSFEEPNRVFDLNIRGTFAVVNFCLQKKAKLVYAGSSTLFSNADESPYTYSKAVNVRLIKDYGKWYGLNYAICYFYNAFGEREVGIGKYATLIAKFELAYLKGEPLEVIMPGTQKRNFTYVKDLAHGMVLVGEKGSGDLYSLNNPKAYSITEIAKAFKCPIKYVHGKPGRHKSGFAPNKAKRLGWSPTLDVMDYISNIIG